MNLPRTKSFTTNQRKTVILLLLFSFCGLSHAKTLYITDEYQVGLRASPCLQCEVVHAGLKTGTRLTQLKDNGDGWIMIRTGTGLKGWILSRYLKKTPVASTQLASAKKRLASAEQKVKALSAKLAELEHTKKVLDGQVQQLEGNNSSVSEELASIKKVASNSIVLNKQNKELSERNSMLQNEIDVLRASNARLSSSERNTGLLYGALAVVIGVLLTIIIPKLKGRKRYSEWG